MSARPSGAAKWREHEAVLVEALALTIEESFRELRRSVRKTLVLVCTALLALMAAPRGGAGRLSLAALYRVLPAAGRPHSRENRLRRFLDNPRLEGRAVTTGLARLLFRSRARGFCPVLLDQTQAGPTQVLVAAVPFEGRALPLVLYTFAYPWRERLPSQNRLEEICLLDVEQSLPAGLVPVFVADRGYARAALLLRCRAEGRLFCVRGRSGTVIEYQGRRQKLGQLASAGSGPSATAASATTPTAACPSTSLPITPPATPSRGTCWSRPAVTPCGPLTRWWRSTGSACRSSRAFGTSRRIWDCGACSSRCAWPSAWGVSSSPSASFTSSWWCSAVRPQATGPALTSRSHGTGRVMGPRARRACSPSPCSCSAIPVMRSRPFTRSVG